MALQIRRTGSLLSDTVLSGKDGNTSTAEEHMQVRFDKRR